jgi:hypothetical protein
LHSITGGVLQIAELRLATAVPTTSPVSNAATTGVSV